MPKKQGLGRGLDAIFDDNAVTAEEGSPRMEISIFDIDPKASQPRKNFDSEALAQLADSITQNGVLQPILVRQVGRRYEIIAGERRFRASKLAGLTKVPVVILDATDLESARYALIENLQREDLNPYEEAQAYSAMIKEYGLSQEEIAAQLGKSRSAVANVLRLLELPEELVRMLVEGSLTQGHARTLLGLRDKTQMIPLAERCVSRNLSVRELEAVVKAANRETERLEKAKKEAEEAEGIDRESEVRVDYHASLESRFTEATGRRCKITETKNRKTFQIEYRDNEDLCELLEKLAGSDFLNQV